MLAEPRLIPVHEPAEPEGVALVLHGGASRRDHPEVSPTQLSVLRMIPTARRIVRVAGDRLAVYRLLNTHRGWDTEHTPVADVAWALERLRESHGDVKVGLVGHSLGGRAALIAGDQPGVLSVVALNPWVYASDDADLTGRRVLIVHGTADRVASPERSEEVARRLATRADLGYIRIPGGKHAMLRRGGDYDGYAAEFTAASLLAASPTSGQADQVPVSSPVARVLAGEEWVTV